jgi:adenylosuccinate synthase
MPLDIVVGTQWGDEGKGHIVDLLASEADYVARFSGGDNAGHTVTIGDETFQLHLVPSGIIHPDTICVMGNGMVINPAVLLSEIDALNSRGVQVNPKRLKISRNAHLITPAHIALDEALEKSKKGDAIGTTKRGIGPAYTDKTARIGIRASALKWDEKLAETISGHVLAKNAELKSLKSSMRLDSASLESDFSNYATRLGSFIADTSTLMHEALANGRNILAEGAQGTLLDLDHGTYPYVTSSWPTTGGALIGLGLGPKAVRKAIGVAKAFSSRVGEGPFPSEVSGDMEIRLRGTGDKPWDEFGTTTGRPRRVGWLDTVILRYSAQINGLTELALTKLDILSGLREIPVCTGYSLEGRQIDHFPSDVNLLSRCQPVFDVRPGWMTNIQDITLFEDLPKKAQDYVQFVSSTVDLPIRLISVGPGREQIIVR